LDNKVRGYVKFKTLVKDRIQKVRRRKIRKKKTKGRKLTWRRNKKQEGKNGVQDTATCI